MTSPAPLPEEISGSHYFLFFYCSELRRFSQDHHAAQDRPVYRTHHTVELFILETVLVDNYQERLVESWNSNYTEENIIRNQAEGKMTFSILRHG